MTVFKVGDRVESIDDTVKGTIVAIEVGTIVIESDDGFPLHYRPSELIKLNTTDSIRVTNHEISQVKSQKEEPVKRKAQTAKPKQRNDPKMEVDLHIGQLVKSFKRLSNYEILEIQLNTAKRQLEFAIQKRIQKVVFIHGVGEGVLREELYALFRRYDNLKYYDADYGKYGAGATEVYIYQNT